MAISVDTYGSFTSSPKSITIASNANRILLVFVHYRTTATTGISFNGTALTKSVTKTYTETTEIWYLLNPDTGTHDITITGGESKFGYLSIYSDNIIGIRGTSTAQADGNISSIISSAVGDLVVDAASNFGTDTPAQGVGQTKMYGVSGSDPYMASYKTGAASVTMAWTGLSQATAQVIVSIMPTIAAGSPVWFIEG